MDTDDTTTALGSAEWGFTTLAYVWDARTRAIIAGADRLEALSEDERVRSLTALSQRVSALTRGLDDGWLVGTAFFMVEDLYKSYFRQFRWTPGVHDYIAATAGVFMQELTRRGFVLHYVIDNTQAEADLEEVFAWLPLVFKVAGLLVTGPQLMALDLMEQADHRSRDVDAIPIYRTEGHFVADRLIERCHQERRSSVYLNLDLDDDASALSMGVALSQGNTRGTILVYRNQAPSIGSVAQIVPPLGVTLPLGGPS